MAYRLTIALPDSAIAQLQQVGQQLADVVPAIVEDSLTEVKAQAVQNLSGVPFASRTGTHTIQKRSGMGAASVQVQFPYGSPFRGRVFAAAYTQYADNPERWNYLAILEEGRGEVRPKYTPSAKAGNLGRARLTIPGGAHNLVSGRAGFRGITGRYRFVKSLPPMEGKYWMESAAQKAQESIPEIVAYHVNRVLSRG